VSAFLVIAWVIAALAITLLLVPLHVRAFGEVDEWEAGGVLTLRWGWGLLEARVAPNGDVDLLSFDRQLYRTKISAPRRDGSPKEKKSGGKSGVLLEQRSTLFEILRRSAVALRLRARVWGCVGLERPDHTAYLAVAIRELNAMARGVDVDIAPNFIEPSVLLKGSVSALVWPVRLLTLAAELVARRDTRRFLQALR
jgi:hypothetical protein